MIDLKQFCSTDKDRQSLHQPFSRGAWTYATNGHVAIRVGRQADVLDQEKPNVERLFDLHYKGDNLGVLCVEIPNVEQLIVRCEACAGTGYEHECPTCRCECEFCEAGKVNETEKISVQIGKAIFDAKYIKLLLSLPEMKFCRAPGTKEAQPFSFEGGEGLLMPMSSHHPRQIAGTVK